ncbi:MAG: hypothetical protein ACYC5M_00700 [Anaerolineae bacterium]
MEALRQRLINRFSRERLVNALPMAALAFFTVCVLLMLVQVVAPQWRTMRAAANELATARIALIQDEAVYLQAPAQAQAQVDRLREQLRSEAAGLFTEDEAAQLRNRLFDHAATHDVAISAMEPGVVSGEVDLDCALETTRVQARGTLPGLLRFVGAQRESLAKGCRLMGVKVVADGEEYVLTMDLLLITSAWASPLEIPAPPIAATLAPSTPSETEELLVRPEGWPTDWPWPPQTPPAP